MKTTTAVLVVCLSATSIKAEQPPDDPTPQVVAACIVGVVVIGVGYVVYSGLTELCKKLPPMEPPPPPPPNPSCTNAVPGHPDWPHTNCSPATASSAFTGQYQGSPSLELSGPYESGEITHLGYADPGGQPYINYFRLTIQASTNLTDWNTECQVNGYKSSGYVLFINSDANGPFSTNGVYLTSGTGTNVVTLPTGIAQERKWFRMVGQ